MPASLGTPQQAQAFVPPANVGGGPDQGGFGQPMATASLGMGGGATVSAQPLPDLSPVTPSMGTQQAMPAQPALAPIQSQPQLASLGTPPANSSAALGAPPTNLGTLSSAPAAAPTGVASAPTGTYTHTILSGESLHTIARRYDVTAQAIVQANALSSPDRITVGQKIVIPGRSDLLANPTPAPQVTEVASVSPAAVQAPVAAAPVAAAPAAPTQTATASAAEPQMSGADNFRWPVNGRVITDFAASRGTGINIEVPAGTSIQAAENGTVIYTGSGVEGYGNLVLVRHPNGYVSAYAHLDNIGVAKGANVERGQSIGTVGMTGSVSRPQLHFELRRGATPVDPMPLLAS